MKTRGGEIHFAPSSGEGVQIDSASEIPARHTELVASEDTTIETKDNEVQDSPVIVGRKEHGEIGNTTNEEKTSFQSEDVRGNKDTIEQASTMERGDVSDPTKHGMEQTDITVAKEAGNEERNQKSENKQGPDLDNCREVSDVATSLCLNENENSLPEVDGHINEYRENMRDSKASIDEVDKIVNVTSNNLELGEITPNSSLRESNLELEDIPLKSSVPKEIDQANTTTNYLELEETPSTSSLSKEAYDNPGFVGDEVPCNINGVSDIEPNVEAVPMKVISLNTNAGNLKLSRRVSFSELPPKAVYENLGCNSDSKHGGENGKVPGQDDGQEIDFLALYGPGEKWRILRNVVLLSAAFMILFTAFFGAANLQSSVNAKAGVGTASLTTLYGALVVSNIFLPATMLRLLHCKWTVALMAVCFAPYAMAQFNAEFYTLFPTALLAGLCAAPMWCAKCKYLNVAADAFAQVTGSTPEVVLVRFFGIFYVLFPLGHVWGNLISSEVLSRGAEEEIRNITVDVASICGANYCPALGETDNPNLERPPYYKINTIAGIFVACSVLAVLLVVVGVDDLSRYNEGGRTDSGTGLSGLELLVATARLLYNRNQIALIPITAFIGVSQAFLGADFTEGYISCAWGIPHIGYVLMGYGLASSLASVFVSWVVKAAGRLVVICSSITLFLILVTVMKFWEPSATQGVVFFTLAALWGLADCTALVINAMYGLMFRGNEAAAYSNFSLWGSVGFIVTYSYSPYLCMNTKLAILSVVLILAMGGFITAEMALRKIIREQENVERTSQEQQQVSTKPHVS